MVVLMTQKNVLFMFDMVVDQFVGPCKWSKILLSRVEAGTNLHPTHLPP